MISQAIQKLSDIAAVAITNQREKQYVAWEKKTGKPVYNAVVWQCQRGAEACKALRSRDMMIW